MANEKFQLMYKVMIFHKSCIQAEQDKSSSDHDVHKNKKKSSLEENRDKWGGVIG